MRYCEDGTAFNYEDPILSKECNCDEIVTHYDSRYSKYAKKDENPKSEAHTDTSSIYQGSNDSKGTTSEKHLNTQDSAIEPQDSKIEFQYTAIEETQESTTETQESTTIISYDDYDESDEKNYPDSKIEPLESTTEPQESTTEYQDLTELQPVLQEGPIAMNKNYDNIIDPIVKAVLKKLELKHAQWHEAIEKSQEPTIELQESTTELQESTTDSQESTTEPQESTTLPQVSTTEPQDPKEFQPVLIEGPILMNKNYNKNRSFGVKGALPHFDRSVNPIPQILADQLILPGGQSTVLKNVDRIVKSVLQQPKVKHTGIEEPKESTTESQDQAELPPFLKEVLILMNKIYEKNIDSIVKAVLKKLELKNIPMEDLQELTTEPQETTTEPQETITEPQDPTELLLASTSGPIVNNKNKSNIIDRIVKAVLKTVEWKHLSIEELQESTTDPHDPTQLQSAVAAVLKKLELNNSGV